MVTDNWCAARLLSGFLAAGVVGNEGIQVTAPTKGSTRIERWRRFVGVGCSGKVSERWQNAVREKLAARMRPI